jgi:hypothetical protein
MISYRAPAYRPGIAQAPQRFRSVQHHQLGQMSTMTAGDWALLLGGAIVGGVGVNNLIGQARAPRMNAVSVLVGLVLAGVGLSLFFQKGAKAVA